MADTKSTIFTILRTVIQIAGVVPIAGVPAWVLTLAAAGEQGAEAIAAGIADGSIQSVEEFAAYLAAIPKPSLPIPTETTPS